ncbi:MAG: phosphate ABC transporter permease PstA [Gammaproteobacteria bacterium]|nr:phosphate ABC transporter permease PstA [Gammaproteobacteria bacterium]
MSSHQTEVLSTAERVNRSLKRRYAAERRFRFYGLASILVALVFLVILLGSIFFTAIPAFQKSYIGLNVTFDAETLGIENIEASNAFLTADYDAVIKAALRQRFPDVSSRSEKRTLYSTISVGGTYQLADMLQAQPELLNTTQFVWLTADDEIDGYFKGKIDISAPESERRIKDNQIAWLESLKANGEVKKGFNWTFLTAGDSREPELAGIRSALTGSFLTLLITLLLSFPLGVAAAIYLEEFAPKNRWTDLIEVNINNLAAVPSIVFGLLGLAVFINFFGLPRSAPIVGGLVLTLMTLPTVIIASRASIQSVPPSIREAALGVGASAMQTVLHHVLPLALPGMLTGTIIGMARALGETAPLLMIGMVAFIVETPQGIFDPSTALPVQIYLWTDSPERAFSELTAAAIIVLLLFLVSMNLLAVLLRRKFERRW